MTTASLHELALEGSKKAPGNFQVTAISPEGVKASMPLDELLARITRRGMDTGNVVLPDGIKITRSQGPITIWVGELSPRVFNFKWIAKDSPAPFGPGTQYRDVRIALPYVIIVAVFAQSATGQIKLTSSSECFFRVKPLVTPDDDLCYPALLNISKFRPPKGRPLAWICTEKMGRTSLNQGGKKAHPLVTNFNALRHCLLETGFNYSSEHNEHSSWYSESRKIDSRLDTVEVWEAASAKDPLFVLDVPWLPTGYTVNQVIKRTFENLNVQTGNSSTANTIARLLFNYQTPVKK